MNIPDFVDQSRAYSSEKLSQASGYRDYLATFDNIEAVSPIKAIAGAGVGLTSLIVPSYMRAGRDITRIPGLSIDLVGIGAATYLAGLAVSALPPEVNNYVKTLPPNEVLEIFTFAFLAVKVPVNVLIHSGLDLFKRKSLL